MFSPHLGVLLEISPSALPNGNGVLVNLHSTVTRWEKPGQTTRIGSIPDGDIGIDVDRINVTAQQFATSMRMPLDKPVLAGGITVPVDDGALQTGAAKSDDGPRRGLYLVLEIHSTDDAPPASARPPG
jgi:hypothetical protein